MILKVDPEEFKWIKAGLRVLRDQNYKDAKHVEEVQALLVKLIDQARIEDEIFNSEYPALGR